MLLSAASDRRNAINPSHVTAMSRGSLRHPRTIGGLRASFPGPRTRLYLGVLALELLVAPCRFVVEARFVHAHANRIHGTARKGRDALLNQLTIGSGSAPPQYTRGGLRWAGASFDERSRGSLALQGRAT